MKDLSKDIFNRVSQLFSHQPWIIAREDRLAELLEFCEKTPHQHLILELLNNFHYLSDEPINLYLRRIGEYIIHLSGFSENTCQIAAITYDKQADSSQVVLQWMKFILAQSAWASVETVNSFGGSLKVAARGKNQIIYVDEFVGSGQTIISRIDYLQKNIRVKSDVKFCFIAGMAEGIRKIENLGFEVFCPLILQKGISDISVPNERYEKIDLMRELEEKLSTEISGRKLSKYSFGYGKAEALYSLEGRSMNTPNSVFPIFWWKRLIDDSVRNTLLTRVD